MARRRGALYRWLRAVVLLVLLLAVLALAAIWYVGAWKIIFPSTHHDTVAPQLPVNLVSPAVLIFSKTNSFRHEDGIAGGNAVLKSIARENGWGMFATENGAVFNARDLAQFDAVVFQSASGDMLSGDQERAFQDWLEAGGGWLGIHAAGDDSHADWQWYMDNLIGAEFTAHTMGPQFQRATVLLEDQGHPVLQGVPDLWDHEEEWYSWARSPRERGFRVLAIVDEDSYTPVQKFLGKDRDLRMRDHPVVWSNCVGKGRSVYVTMGHKAAAFANVQVTRILENSLAWLMGLSPGGC